MRRLAVFLLSSRAGKRVDVERIDPHFEFEDPGGGIPEEFFLAWMRREAIAKAGERA